MTTPGGETRPDPYLIGRVVTIAYVHTRDKLDADKRKAVTEVYAIFNDLMMSLNDEDTTHFELLLKEKVIQKVDNEAARILALEVIDRYWSRLNDQVPYGELKADRRINVLREFHRGIQEALKDYGG
jgi:hypothetical protein